ncbi:hypothetical protein L218DRAFT_951807 [Marasmius fiardii PR-910]|nr:hypothetical protein L218DRAFT_951807 [Marasmius fiardii PR-910]
MFWRLYKTPSERAMGNTRSNFPPSLLLPLLAQWAQVSAVPAEVAAATSVTATVSSQPTAATNASFASDAFTNVNPVGQVVTAQGLNNQPTLLVYQDASSGDLIALGVSNSFSIGHRTAEPVVIVPKAEILWGSPLAIVNYGQGLNDAGFVQIFYLSLSNVVTEVGGAWQTASGVFDWAKGPIQCPTCIDSNVVFRAAWGSKVFYAMAVANTQANAGVRVVFQSADYPDGVLVEAEFVQATLTWGLYPLKD